MIKQGFQKALSIPQKDLRKPKKPSNENILPFITTFNPNNPNIYSTVTSSVNCLKNNNVGDFHNIKLMQCKKNRFTCDSFNLIYVVICGTCKEKYIGETGEGKTKLRNRVRVYRQHIRQPTITSSLKIPTIKS